MNVFFYKKEDEEDFILQYETCSYNNIPRIGEEVIIKDKWYLGPAGSTWNQRR